MVPQLGFVTVGKKDKLAEQEKTLLDKNIGIGIAMDIKKNVKEALEKCTFIVESQKSR